MSQPQRDSFDSFAGLQQLHRCRVAHSVWGDSLAVQARHRRCCRRQRQCQPLRDVCRSQARATEHDIGQANAQMSSTREIVDGVSRLAGISTPQVS